MTTDDLDQKTNAELSEVFTVEVARTVKCDAWLPGPHPLMGLMKGGCGHENCHPTQLWPPKVAEYTDSVLPWLEKYICGATKGHARITAIPKNSHEVSVIWRILIAHSLAVGIADAEGCSSSFARAAYLAIIRAKRAAK